MAQNLWKRRDRLIKRSTPDQGCDQPSGIRYHS
ncbi:Bgt-20535 [Blumeria graminis f. sp. tritici]|uniref:Bgt-20535 n=1 Tax=Blumeria graminis f. sp. tritici TaxID=62690 RepID=A0A9X9QBM9_BLUGR|nr:Bgt-20535 [Blumeria graminis f. sp. tritici]